MKHCPRAAAMLVALTTLVTAMAAAPAAQAQDRNQLKAESKREAAAFRAAGEPMDRCYLAGGMQGGFMTDLPDGSALQTGDRLVKLNGTDVSDKTEAQIEALIRPSAPETSLAVTVIREGAPVELQVICANARPYFTPALLALDLAAKGKFEDCFNTLKAAAVTNAYNLVLQLKCAAQSNRLSAADVGEVMYRIALLGVEGGRVIPERRTPVLTFLRQGEAQIIQARGETAFRKLIEATRRWPGGERMWDESEPNWSLMRTNSEAAIRRALIDPGSAQFEWPRGFAFGSWKPFMAPRVEGYYTCGLVNARNRMGGYVGATSFVVVVSSRGQVLYSEMGTNTDFDILAAQCAQSQSQLPPPQAGMNEPPEPPAGARRGANAAPSLADELKKLADLRASGVLTEEEFQAAKARLLAPPAGQ